MKIVGKIADCKEKSLTVTFGVRTIHVDLADLPTINVELADPQLVTAGSKSKIQGTGVGRMITMTADDVIGSKIVVHGTGAETKTDRQCAAKSITVTLAKPLTGDKSTAAKTKRTASAEK